MVKPAVIDMSVKRLQINILSSQEAKSKLKMMFRKLHPCAVKSMSGGINTTVCRLAARKLVNKALQVRMLSAKSLLKTIERVKSILIKDRIDFGESCHSASTEPYFYDAAYQPVQRDVPIPVNMQGKCFVAKEIALDHESAESMKRWECSCECKPISKGEVNAILCLKVAFELSVEEVRAALATCDYGCPYGHYTKLEGSMAVDRKGHPIICDSGSECTSQLRILRAASTHFPVLRQFLREVHNAIGSHNLKKVFINVGLCEAWLSN